MSGSQLPRTNKPISDWSENLSHQADFDFESVSLARSATAIHASGTAVPSGTAGTSTGQTVSPTMIPPISSELNLNAGCLAV